MHISLTPKLESKIQNKVSAAHEALSFMDKNDGTVQQVKLNHLHQAVAIGAEQHPDRCAPTPLTSGELKTPAAGNSPSPVKGWTQSGSGELRSKRVSPGGRGSLRKNTTP